MTEDKEEKIIKRLKEIAGQLQYGMIVVELKVTNGKIMAGDIIQKKEKLG